MALKKCRDCGKDVSTQGAACPTCGALIKKKSGFFRFVGGTILVFITLLAISVLINGVSNPLNTSTPAVEKVSEQDAKQRYEACTATLENARGGGMPYEFDTKGASIHVRVGQGFLAAPIDVKLEFAKTINCVALKGAGGGVPFDVIHWQTGKRIANWNGYRLDVEQGGETLDPYSSSSLYSTP